MLNKCVTFSSFVNLELEWTSVNFSGLIRRLSLSFLLSTTSGEKKKKKIVMSTNFSVVIYFFRCRSVSHQLGTLTSSSWWLRSVIFFQTCGFYSAYPAGCHPSFNFVTVPLVHTQSVLDPNAHPFSPQS